MPPRAAKRRRIQRPSRSTPSVEHLGKTPKSEPEIRRNPRRSCRKETEGEIRDIEEREYREAMERKAREWRERMWRWVEAVETPAIAHTTAQGVEAQPVIKVEDNEAINGNAMGRAEASQSGSATTVMLDHDTVVQARKGAEAFFKDEEISEYCEEVQIKQEKEDDTKVKIEPGLLRWNRSNDNLTGA